MTSSATGLVINARIVLAAVAAAAVLAAAPAAAERATAAEARVVAESWIALVAQAKGEWAGRAVRVERVDELRRDGRTVGYVATVRPAGYIVVSAFKELAPVKAYSSFATLDFATDDGMPGLIKDRLETMVRRLIRRAGERSAELEDVERQLDTCYRAAWQELGVGAGSTTAVSAMRLRATYAGGQVMLATAWHQGAPYNRDCPQLFGSESCANAVVGCVPLAAAQIMRYWAWPPYGAGFPYSDPYDWTEMPEALDGDSTVAQVSAVAELAHETGEAADVDYGCGGTSGDLACHWPGCTSMQDAYRDTFRFAGDTDDRDRDAEDSAEAWFEWVKSQIGQNRPLHYRIPGHNVVVDGWQEVGELPLRQYHVNYGWGEEPDDNLGWFTVDEIPGGEPDEEYMLVNLRPAVAIGASASGQYTRDSSFPYRYVDVDAAGDAALFEAGQNLQFLPGTSLTGTGQGSDRITIASRADAPTTLFTEGDATRGIALKGGSIWLAGGAAVSMLPVGPPKFLTAFWESELQAVTLRWELGHGDVTAHVVERKLGYYGEWQGIGEAGGTSRAYVDGTVQRGLPYFYRIRSRGGAALSTWSRIVSIMSGTAS